jgi:pyruvate,water dikinase
MQRRGGPRPASLHVISTNYVLDFADITLRDVARVGGKNASLGELFRVLKPKGVGVLDGFATTAEAYRNLLATNGLEHRLRSIFTAFDAENLTQLAERGEAARRAVVDTPLPQELQAAILAAYDRLCARTGREPEMAVRSSATAEDLPEASFAGAAETFLNVRGREALLRAVHACCASLFTDRAISYRARLGYDQLKVALSVGVMPMVRSDKASAGVMFTLDTESGFRDVVAISGSYGLGEFVVKGTVIPDEWTVFKPTLKTGHPAIIGRQLGTKDVRLIYSGDSKGTRSERTPAEARTHYCLSDDEVLTLARWAYDIEEHYSDVAGHPQPMDIEWAKDGVSNELVIVQARPETVHSAKPRAAVAETFKLTAPPGPPLLTGQAVGQKIGVGRVRVVRDVAHLDRLQQGEVLVAEMTIPIGSRPCEVCRQSSPTRAAGRHMPRLSPGSSASPASSAPRRRPSGCITAMKSAFAAPRAPRGMSIRGRLRSRSSASTPRMCRRPERRSCSSSVIRAPHWS